MEGQTDREKPTRPNCNIRQKRAAGTWVDGEAEIVQGQEINRVMDLFRKEYGPIGNMMVGFVARLRGERLTTIISIKPKR
jgi:hypothetical protein